MYNPETTPTEAFAPLTLRQFTKYFLIPYVATELIAEDLNMSYEEAWEELVASGDVGENLQRDIEHEHLDDIHVKNVKSAGRNQTRKQSGNATTKVTVYVPDHEH